jgi:hypothetical protein
MYETASKSVSIPYHLLEKLGIGVSLSDMSYLQTDAAVRGSGVVVASIIVHLAEE